MRKIQNLTFALLFGICLFLYSCGPSDDNSSMDQNTSQGEGEVDSTRLPNLDSAARMSGDTTTAK